VLSIVSTVGSWGIVVLNFSSFLTCSVSLSWRIMATLWIFSKRCPGICSIKRKFLL
jgi:hypothetical protein